MARNYENNNSKVSKFPGLTVFHPENKISAKTISQRVKVITFSIFCQDCHIVKYKNQVSLL